MAIDMDAPCPHMNFEAIVSVARIKKAEDGPIVAFMAEVTIECEDCKEPFRWSGVRPGLNYTEPTTSLDNKTLHAPLRPASADSDFGLGLPDFTIQMHSENEE